jgi:hypothetical protein
MGSHSFGLTARWRAVLFVKVVANSIGRICAQIAFKKRYRFAGNADVCANALFIGNDVWWPSGFGGSVHGFLIMD